MFMREQTERMARCEHCKDGKSLAGKRTVPASQNGAGYKKGLRMTDDQ